MGFDLAALKKYRQLIGIGVAAVLLAAIFVPFQNAEAFTVTIDLPDSDDDTVTQSVSGEPFEVEINVEAGELISISSIELILDNEESSVKRTTFDDEGVRTSGSTSLVIGNEVDIDSSSDLNDYGYGYGYGYGYASSGTTFSAPYSYAFTYNYAFIGGNTGGYTNSGVTDFVAGLLGPGTITISGNIRTADLAEGTHTLDVLIDTGAGGNGVDQLTSAPLVFTVEEAEGLVNEEVAVDAGETEVPEFEVELDGEDVPIAFSFSAATTTSGNAVVTLQTQDDFFDSLDDPDDFALDETGDGIVLIDDDGNEFIIAGLIVDIDLSALGLPDGTEVTISLGYNDAGLTTSEEEDLRLFHFNDVDGVWEALTNDDPTINGGDEVDTGANIVYGTTDDFSLFAPATATSGDGGGGGGGGTNLGGGQTVYLGVLPEKFLAEHPLLRFQITDHALVDANGERLTSVKSGEQVMIVGSFKNNQGHAQDYAFIVQVIDEDGITRDIGWITGDLDSQGTFEGSRSWLASDPGNYTVNILIWNTVEGTPTPLTEIAESSFRVTS